jgi:MFS family permease
VALLVLSGVSMCLCHVAMAVLAAAAPSQTIGVVTALVACAFVASFAVGWGPIPWTLCSEIFPMRLRSKATAVTTATNWLSNTLLGKLFPLLPLPLAFGLFAAECACGVVVAYLLQPETANLSLEEIDVAFARHTPRRARKFWAEAARHAQSPRLMLAADGRRSDDPAEAATVGSEPATATADNAPPEIQLTTARAGDGTSVDPV